MVRLAVYQSSLEELRFLSGEMRLCSVARDQVNQVGVPKVRLLSPVESIGDAELHKNGKEDFICRLRVLN